MGKRTDLAPTHSNAAGAATDALTDTPAAPVEPDTSTALMSAAGDVPQPDFDILDFDDHDADATAPESVDVAESAVLAEAQTLTAAQAGLAAVRASIADLKNKIDAAAKLVATLESERFHVRADAEAFHDISQRMAFARTEGERLALLLDDALADEARAIRAEQKAFAAHDVAAYHAEIRRELPALEVELVKHYALFIAARARLQRFTDAVGSRVRAMEPWYRGRAVRSAEIDARHLVEMTRQNRDVGALAPAGLREIIAEALLTALGYETPSLPECARYAPAGMITDLVNGGYASSVARVTKPQAPPAVPATDPNVYLTPLRQQPMGVYTVNSHASVHGKGG